MSLKLEDVKQKRRVTENVVEEAQQRIEDVKEQLKSNENYRQISHLEEKLTDFMEENKTLQETFDQLRKVLIFACYILVCIYVYKFNVKNTFSLLLTLFRNSTLWVLEAMPKKN